MIPLWPGQTRETVDRTSQGHRLKADRTTRQLKGGIYGSVSYAWLSIAVVVEKEV